MPEASVHEHREDGVTLLTLHDLSARNALSSEMASELSAKLDAFEVDAAQRVLVLTGTDPSFCSGANVRRFDQAIEAQHDAEPQSRSRGGVMEADLARRESQGDQAGFSVSDVPLRVHQVQKPTIAAVNGHAIGVGLGLALSCDIRIASDDAEFAEAFVRMGLVPGDGSCWQLPRMIGLSNTFFMQYTGDRIDAAEALRVNLASKVYPHDEMMDAAMELARRLAAGATYSMSLTKYLVHKSMSMELEDSLRLAQTAQEQARRSEDHQEAVRAFLGKRKASFKGR